MHSSFSVQVAMQGGNKAVWWAEGARQGSKAAWKCSVAIQRSGKVVRQAEGAQQGSKESRGKAAIGRSLNSLNHVALGRSAR